MKRAFLIVVLLATLASSMTLRKGASLGYLAKRYGETDTCFVMLTVGDSTITDSGVLWDVAVRDSAIGSNRIRSAQAVLMVADGDTVWQTPSCLAAWDPASRKVDSATWKAGDKGVFPYGGLEAACRAYPVDSKTWRPSGLLDSVVSGYKYSITGLRRTIVWGKSYDPKDPNFPWKISLEAPSVFDAPLVLAVPDTGLVRFAGWGEEWVLAAMDGNAVGKSPLSKPFVDFNLGERWTWSYASSWKMVYMVVRTRDVRSVFSWEVVGVEDDSAGWLRRSIRIVSVTTADTNDAGRVTSSTTGTDDIVPLRIHYESGAITLGTQGVASTRVAPGMIHLWSDLPKGSDGWLRSVIQTSGNTVNGSKTYSSSSLSKKGYGLISGSISIPGDRSTESISMALLVHDKDTLSYEGLQTLASRRYHKARDGLRSFFDLEKELSTRPGATLRLTSVSGKSEIHSGAEALRTLRSRHGIVLLELRDGDATIPGRLLLP